MANTHEVVGKSHVRSSSQNDDETEAGEPGWTEFEVGDEITPTDDELRSFPDRFRELRAPAQSSAEEAEPDEGTEESEPSEEPEPESSEEPEAPESPLDLDDMTVQDVAEALETGDYDDQLDAIEAAESAGQDRAGVYNAIEERR